MNDLNKDTSLDFYFNDVIKRGDEASGSFLTACKEGNKSSIAHYLNMLNRDGSIKINEKPDHTHVRKIKAVRETIDGVGTKVQIYTNQFENIFQMRDKKEIDGEKAKSQSTELRERMLMDLIAMNSDDLRGGELAIGATNIIDINHLRGARGHLFQDSMAEAMKNVIQETGIAMLAGETAVLGQSPEAVKMYREIDKTLEEIGKILIEDKHKGDGRGPAKINKPIQDIINNFYDKIKIQSEQISFNIGGTCTGLASDGEKLIKLKDGQVIVGLQEIPVDGIIGPRSNGITKIRDDMYTIMGDGWENMTFEDFIEKIGKEKSQKIPEDVKKVCRGKKLWNIATGKTTVFNPFVANQLLGGIEKDALVGISSIIHVTGNPLKKISEGINKDQKESYNVKLDISRIAMPHIIVLLQAALDISDEQAMNKWNMGVPYVLLCEPEDASIIIRKASDNNIDAEVIGRVKEKIDGKKSKNIITGVGLNKSKIQF